MAPLATGTRRRRCVVLDDGTAVGCYVRSTHETHTVVVEPAGHAYSYIRPNGALSRHLTPTALSAHRELVQDAVALRNRFAWHTAAPHAKPYLHLALEDSRAVRYQRRLRSTRARWPGSGTFYPHKLFNARDQRFELQSIEGLARVRLHRSGLLADLFFLAEVRATVDSADEREDSPDSAFAHYTTVHQTVVVACVPDQFALPVEILLHAKEAYDNGRQEAFDFQLDEERHSVMSSLPVSSAFAARSEFSAIAPQALAAATSPSHGLPLPEILRVATMPARHFYRRVAVEVQEDESTFFMPTSSGSEIVILSPHDQSVLACRGEFFKWFHASGRLLQQFTMETIPPTAFIAEAGSGGSLLSLCRHTQYVLQSFRGVDQAKAVPSAGDPEHSDSETSATIVEEVENEHGRFRAFRDGKVRVIFADRTILQVQQKDDTCKFFFPDGSSGATTLAAAPLRQRMYIHRALEFADWAFATLDERMERFRRRQHVKEVTQQELKRISVRFGLNMDAESSDVDGQRAVVGSMAPFAESPDAATRLAAALSPEMLTQVQSDTMRHISAVNQALQTARALSSDALH